MRRSRKKCGRASVNGDEATRIKEAAYLYHCEPHPVSDAVRLESRRRIWAEAVTIQIATYISVISALAATHARYWAPYQCRMCSLEKRNATFFFFFFLDIIYCIKEREREAEEGRAQRLPKQSVTHERLGAAAVDAQTETSHLAS